MRWLKSIVIVLGILIVLGVVSLGYGLYKKTSEPGWKPFPERAKNIEGQQQNREPSKPFGTISLDLADGCIITKVLPKQRNVYFMIGKKPSCNAVILVDLKKGVVLGRIVPQK